MSRQYELCEDPAEPGVWTFPERDGDISAAKQFTHPTGCWRGLPAVASKKVQFATPGATAGLSSSVLRAGGGLLLPVAAPPGLASNRGYPIR